MAGTKPAGTRPTSARLVIGFTRCSAPYDLFLKFVQIERSVAVDGGTMRVDAQPSPQRSH